MTKALAQRGGKLYDLHGREVILHGVNMVHKISASLPWQEEDFRKVREWGMNVIRLGMTWYGIEPEPGLYDEDYFTQLLQCVEWARKHDLYVILDMHQDCFSYRVTKEHPDNQRHEWYALTDGLPHENQGSTWSDAYATSPAVKRMFDNFWRNAPAGDGIGLQDHYASAWERIAEAFADDPTVIGYNIMNEPNPGSLNDRIMVPILLRGAAALFFRRGRFVTSLDQVVALWLDKEHREEITGLFANTSLFRRVIGAGGRILRKAERTLLLPFYAKVRTAIRKQDPRTMIAVEPMTAEYMGVRSGLTNAWIGDDGGSITAMYMPHLYDIVVDTDNDGGFSTDRLHAIGACHVDDASRMGLPLTIGEWGAFGPGFGNAKSAGAYVAFFENHLAGDIYWAYSQSDDDVGTSPYFRGIHRPVVSAAAGTLLSVHTDEERGVFEEVIETNGSRSTLVYVPGSISDVNVEDYTENPAGEWGTYLTIPTHPPGGPTTFTIHFTR